MGLPKSIDELDGAWLGQALHEAGRIADPAGVTIKRAEPLATGTAYSTMMWRIELDGPHGTPRTAVVKLPVQGEVRQLLDGITAYLREVTFYAQLASEVPVRVPEPYVAAMENGSTDFVLILEDLSDLEPADQLRGLTLQQAEAAVDALAAFHAWSWEHPRLEGLKAQFPPLGSVMASRIYGQFMQYFALSWQRARELDAVADEVKAFGDRLPELLPFFVERLSTPRTISHGELRAENLFLLEDGGLLLIDFQAVAQQAGIIDVAYLISSSVDEEVRRGHEEALVRRYQEQLAAAGVTGYNFERAWEQFRIAVAFMLLMPGLAFMQYEQTNDRGKQLLVEMLARASDTIVSIGALELLP